MDGSVTGTDTSKEEKSIPVEKSPKSMGCSCGRYKGLIYTVVASFWTIVWSSAAKNLNDFTPIEVTLYAMTITGSLSLPMVVWNQRSMPRIQPRHLVLWVVLSATKIATSVLKTSAYQLLPLGEASSIAFSTPIFTAIFARIVLKDRLTWMTLISLFLSLVGMILTMKLPEMISSSDLTEHIDITQHITGCAYAIGGVIAASAMFILYRSLRDMPPLVNTLVNSFTDVVLCLCIIPAYGGFHQPLCDISTSLNLIAMGTSGYVTTVFMTLALQLEDPTTMGTVYRSCDIILAFLVQVVYFGDNVDAYSVSGALVVFGCGLLMPLQKWMEGKPVDSRLRKSWLLK